MDKAVYPVKYPISASWVKRDIENPFGRIFRVRAHPYLVSTFPEIAARRMQRMI